MNVLLKGEGMTKEDLSKKNLSFGANGVNFFQRETGVTKQIKDSWASFFMGVHCVVYKTK